MYYINNERKIYLEARGKVVLNACPGSGKTTTIAKKILEIENLKEISSHSGIACLSFTNAAKDEINEAYMNLAGRQIQFPNHVSTIDSFINKYITLPFYNVLNRNFNRPKILDHTDILDNMWKTKYTDRTTGELREGLVWPLNSVDYKGKDNRSIYHLYKPSEIRIEPDGTFSIGGKQPLPEKVEYKNFINYCKFIKKTQFEKGLISTGDSAYIALFLLRKNPRISQWLSRRFPHIIIDEAQDNSLLQHAIFDELTKNGLTNLELIGDPYQSLYEWRDASPKEFLTKYSNDTCWQAYNLTDNRRSSQNIIDIFSLVRISGDPKINSLDCAEIEDSIVIYKYNTTNFQNILEHYESRCLVSNFKKSCIVVRGNTLKDKLLGKEKEQRPWNSDLPTNLIELKNLYLGGDVKNAINQARKIFIKLIYKVKDEFHDLKEIERRKKEDPKFNSLIMNTLYKMPDLSNSIQQWTKDTEIFLKEQLGLDHEIDFLLKKRKSKYFEKTTLLDPVSHHFQKSFSKYNIPITTIHQVKGQTLDSILVFFNERKHKDNITFDNISNEQDVFPDETRRLIYVALSRPKYHLAMAFPKSVSNKKLYEKFGENIQIIPI
ncbi:ATP-dependent helicase [Chryseobacterium sp. POE27]|uniref:ATP-dependent helicase n=1 Tax=Chryseobacterium sp. POE27 TaxID=3138177 RepID=UPI00321BC517